MHMQMSIDKWLQLSLMLFEFFPNPNVDKYMFGIENYTESDKVSVI